MKNLKFALSILAMCAVFLQFSCGEDDPCDDLSATYDGAVKSIIDNSCAYSGCHSGTDANPYINAASNDYTSFTGLSASLTAAKFTKRVLDDQNMPPADFVPDGKPKTLTASELEILQCWADAGFPEN